MARVYKRSISQHPNPIVLRFDLECIPQVSILGRRDIFTSMKIRPVSIDSFLPPSKKQVQECLQKFVGFYNQEIPQYSATKYHGRRRSDLIREGYSPATQSKLVQIDSIELLEYLPGVFPEVTIEVHCHSGTYIRSLCRDVAKELGTSGVVTKLIRTESNGQSLDVSCSL